MNVCVSVLFMTQGTSKDDSPWIAFGWLVLIFFGFRIMVLYLMLHPVDRLTAKFNKWWSGGLEEHILAGMISIRRLEGLYIYIHIHVYVNIHIYIFTYIYTYIYIHIYICIYTWLCYSFHSILCINLYYCASILCFHQLHVLYLFYVYDMMYRVTYFLPLENWKFVCLF
jgi:hypothetical protein